MSIPQIPDGKHRPSFSEVIIDLLESIALEEIALAHLINAEAEKVQAFVGKNLDFPTRPSNVEINKFNNEVFKLIDVIVMKEWLLLRKFENVIHCIDYD
ncbi:hypothetical protein MK805_17400 [Shimazuella sp. AN120528]|uniref:hypothetical protein n=1 Tax=Shimazuella soli TaxID=1892854 RepID=UPI001F11456E|nr:hypothetical protein [Shimazuella soli]MCH5586709.1 hypothetical protein [Shimazuella soli]